MRLRNRDTNIDSNVKNLKRMAITKPDTPAAKRKDTSDPISKTSYSKPMFIDTGPKFSSPKPKFTFDEKHLHDPIAVANFAQDIFQYLQSREPTYQLPGCLKENICDMNRAMVVDWLVECQENFSFDHETLYTAIRLFDIYIAASPLVGSEQLQLVAASSFLIATKVEDYNPISISTLEGMCPRWYKKSDFKTMEREILQAARCDLGFPLAYSFLRRYARVVGADMKLLTLARFYLEVSAHYVKWSLEPPSKVATLCLVLALEKTDCDLDWAPALEYYSNYPIADLVGLLLELDDSIACFKKTFPQCQVVISKYSSEDFFEVARDFLA